MKTCKVCKSKFEPSRPMQTACSVACAIQAGRSLSAKKDRKETRERKERLKTRSDWLKEAQKAFNAYIRERDKHKPCICCGKPLTLDAVGGGFDCGHYRSTGSAPHLRFNEDNAHGQRKACNRYGAGRAVDYRIGLVQRIGIDRVEALECDNSVKKWSADDLKAIRDHYRKLLFIQSKSA